MSERRRPGRSRLAKTPLLIAATMGVALSLAAIGVFSASAEDRDDGPIAAAWEAAREAGSYQFSGDVVQVSAPAATVANAGRVGRSQTLYMEGDTDLDASAMELSLSANASSDPANTVGVRVVDGVTSQREGAGEWTPAAASAETVVPAGDFLAYLDAARNVTELGTDTRGGVSFTRYGFRVDGPAFADGVIGQMEQSGEIPAGARVTLPAMYNGLEGDGELWVNAEGMPIRQIMALNFGEQAGEAQSATITMDFSEFGTATVPGVERATGWSLSSFMSEHRDAALTLVALVAALLVLFVLSQYFGTGLLTKRKLSMVVTFGLVGGVLVMSNAAAAGAGSTTGSGPAVSEQQAASDVTQAIAEQRRSELADPHEDRLAGLDMDAPAAATGGGALLAQAIDPDLDPTLDSDDDGLTDYVEVRIGTDPDNADTDGDTLDDADEVAGFNLGNENCGGGPWFGDPGAPDSNGDGLPDGEERADTDGDCIPDMFEDDNDNDGVPDRLDLAPFSGGEVDYSQTNALDLTIDGLTATEDVPVFVDFQLRPTDEAHLAYALRTLDWPSDNQGQIRDVNSSNDDIRLIPMLEITIPDTHQLPSPEELEPYSVTVTTPENSDVQNVFVPLSVVNDSETGEDVAFGGRMRYSSTAELDTAQSVRLVWVVQAKNDVPCNTKLAPEDEGYRAGCTDDGYVLDVPQPVHTYYENWKLTGLSVTEEHGTDMAVIYEDPSEDSERNDDQPTWALGEVLTQRFVSANSAGEFEITMNDPGADSYIGKQIAGASPAYGLPADVFQVVMNEYATFDEAVVRTAGDAIPSVLAAEFADGITERPLITTAFSYSSRALNVDAGSGFVTVAGNGLTLDFETLDETPIQTSAGVKWNQFCGTGGATAWAACDLAELWDQFDARYGNELFDPDDPTQSITEFDPSIGDIADSVARGQNQIAKLHISMMINGVIGVNQLIRSNGAREALIQSDKTNVQIFDSVGVAIGSGTKPFAGSLWIGGLQAAGETPAETFALINDLRGAGGDIKGLAAKRSAKAGNIGAGLFAAVVVAYVVVVALVPQDDQALVGAVLGGTLASVGAGFTALKFVQSSSNLRSLLAGSSIKNLGVSVKASVLTAVIVVGLSWGFFIAQMLADEVTAFSAEFNVAFAGVIADSLFVALTTALAFTGVGLVIVAIVAVADGIAAIVCEVEGIDDCFSISKKVTKAITFGIFGSDPMVDLKATDLVQTDAPQVSLDDQLLGYVPGNALKISLPVETNIRHESPDAWQMAFYLEFYSRANIAGGSFEHTVSAPGAGPTPSTSSGSNWGQTASSETYLSKQLFRAEKQELLELEPIAIEPDDAGLNHEYKYFLNSAYALPSYECWTIPTPPTGLPLIPVCYKRQIDGSSSTELVPLVYDILPATLSDFMETETRTGRPALAWDDRFAPLSDADGDGLLSSVDGGLDPDDAAIDKDEDGLSDRRELELRSEGIAVSPVTADTDNDGLSDLQEVRLGTNPNLVDTDNDGLTDAEEARHINVDGELAGGWDVLVSDANDACLFDSRGACLRVYSDPTVFDTDGDGLSDEAEKQLSELEVEFLDADDKACTPPSEGCEPRGGRNDDRGFPYHPNVVNSPPIDIAIRVGGTDGFVKPGETVTIATDVTAKTPLAPSVLDMTLPVGGAQAPALLDFDPSDYEATRTQRVVQDPFTIPADASTLEIEAGVRGWLPDLPDVEPSLDLRPPASGPQNGADWLDLTARGADRTDSFVLADTTLDQNVRNSDPLVGSAVEFGTDRFSWFGEGNPREFFDQKGNPTSVRPRDPRRDASVACTDDGDCMTVWNDLDNCATLTIHSGRVVGKGGDGGNGLEPKIFFDHTPADAFFVGELEPLWPTTDLGFGPLEWFPTTAYLTAPLDGNREEFPASYDFCGDTNLVIREIDGLAGPADDDPMYASNPAGGADLPYFALSPTTSFGPTRVRFGNIPGAIFTDQTFSLEFSVETNDNPVSTRARITSGNSGTFELSSAELTVGAPSAVAREAVVASDGDGFAVARVDAAGQGILTIYDGSGTFVRGSQHQWGSNLDIAWVRDRYVVTSVKDWEASSSLVQVVAAGYPNGVLPAEPAHLTLAITAKSLVGDQNVYDFAFNPTSGTAVLVFADAVGDLRSHTIVNFLQTLDDAVADTTISVDAAAIARSSDGWRFLSAPQVEFNPITDGWTVLSVEQNGSVKVNEYATLFDAQANPEGLTVLSVNSDPDSDLKAPARLACPAWTSFPVIDLRFEELPAVAGSPAVSTFVDSSGSGLDAVATIGTAPDAGAAGAVLVAERSHFAAGFNPGDVLRIPNPVHPDQNPVTNDLSIAFWYRAAPSTSDEPFVITTDDYELSINNENGFVNWASGDAVLNSEFPTPFQQVPVNDNEWHFIVATLGDGKIGLRVDEQIASDGPGDSGNQTPSTGVEYVPTSTSVEVSGGSPSSIDQLQFYNTVLGDVAIDNISGRTAPFCMFSALSDLGTDPILDQFVSTESAKIDFVDPDPRGGSITASETFILRVDRSAPTVSATVPSEPIAAPTGKYVLAGEAQDGDGSGVAMVEVSLDGGATWTTAEGSEAWSLLIDVDDGVYEITTRATDQVGYVSEESQPSVLRVDRVVPVVALDLLPAALAPATDDTTGALSVELSGTVTDSGTDWASGIAENGVEVRVARSDAGEAAGDWQVAATAAGAWLIDYAFLTTQADISGDYTVTVRATDRAGNATPDDAYVEASVILDSAAPVAELSADDQALTVVAGDITLSGSVTDLDGSGVNAVEVSFTSVDAADPEWRSANLAQSGPGATATTWNLEVPDDLEGFFQIDLRATDDAGNELVNESVWSGIVDTQAPRLTLTAEPDGAVARNGRLFRAEFACGATDLFLSERDFSCPGRSTEPPVRGFLEEGDLRTALEDLFPDQTIVTTLTSEYAKWEPSGTQTIDLAACDFFGNCATLTDTVTNTPQAGAIAEDQARPQVAEFNIGGAALQTGVVLNAAVISPTPGEHIAADGSIDVLVSADAPASIKTITVSSDGVDVETLSFAADAVDSHQQLVSIPVAAGPNTVSIRVEDWDGATATSSTVDFFADAAAPTVTLDSSDIGPDGSWAVGTDMLRFGGTVSDDGTIATVQIKIGDGPWTDVTFDQVAGTWQTAVQVPGADGSTLSVQVRAIDLAGRVGQTGNSVNVDLAPVQDVPYVRPDTTIESGPATSGTATSAAFTFGSTDGDAEVAGFQCVLDGNQPVPCEASSTFDDLSAGTHTLAVSAIDEDGYDDLSPATFTWSVIGTGPQATLSAQPANPTTERDARFVFSGGNGATFECALDGAELASCTSPQTFTDLADGDHSFAIRTTLNGVTGSAIAVDWNVVNEAPEASDQAIVVASNDPVGRPVTLVADDTDEVIYRIVEQPQHGLLVGTPPNIAYVPFTNFLGTDRFSFVADDGQNESALGNVSVEVTAGGPFFNATPADVAASTKPGATTATVTYPTPAATDLLTTPSVVCAPASGTSFPVGTTTVTCTATGTDGLTATTSFKVNVTATAEPDSGADIVPIEPVRLLDTRPGGETIDELFEAAGKVAAGSFTKVQIAGRGGVPADAVGIEVNLTAIQNEGRGFATLYPCTATPPTASTLNYTQGVNIANATTVALNSSGEVCVYTSSTSHYALDVVAFIPAGSAVGTIEPVRLLDTRPGGETIDELFQAEGKVEAGTFTKVQIAGRGGVPADAVGIEVNLTAIQNEGRGFATLYPCTAKVPTASTLNYTQGVNIANATTVALNSDGEVCVYTSSTSHYALDVVAFIPAGSAVGTIEPVRLLDTRPGGETIDELFQGDGKVEAGTFTKVQIAGRGGIPTDAVGIEVNLTAIQNEGRGFATLYPCTATPPTASTLNYTAGVNIANATTVALNSSGEVCVYTSSTSHYALDVVAFITN